MGSSLLTGRGAVVVGGSRGVGAAVAAVLAAHGAGVVVNGRDPDAVSATCAQVPGSVAHPGVASDPDVAESLVEVCVERFGRIDALVNCAGIAEPRGSSILTVSHGEFRELLDAHLGTVFASCRAAAPRMAAAGRGAIVNTGSVAFLGDFGGTGYPAGKGAVNSLTCAIAAELNEHGVRANVVCPGARTRLSTGPDYEEHIADLNRRGLLDDVSAHAALHPAAPQYTAPIYAYLVSDLAAEVTGRVFVAAGGFVGEFTRPTPAVLGYRDTEGSPPWSPAEIAAMVDARA